MLSVCSCILYIWRNFLSIYPGSQMFMSRLTSLVSFLTDLLKWNKVGSTGAIDTILKHDLDQLNISRRTIWFTTIIFNVTFSNPSVLLVQYYDQLHQKFFENLLKNPTIITTFSKLFMISSVMLIKAWLVD